MSNTGQYFPSAPPAPPAKSGPSCLLLGGIGCLVIVVLVVVVVGVIAYKAKGIIGNAISVGTSTMDIELKLAAIRNAVVKYDDVNGKYPANLKQLVPTYLPYADLHASTDANPDPNHVSFTYVKPPQGAALTTEIVEISYTPNFGVGNSQTSMKMYYAETLGGQIVQATRQGGRLINRVYLPPPATTPSAPGSP
jgi:hypothetical protein